MKLLLSNLFLGSDPEDGSDEVLRNIGSLSPEYAALHPRRDDSLLCVYKFLYGVLNGRNSVGRTGRLLHIFTCLGLVTRHEIWAGNWIY
jgi:hypothetical protein